MHPDEGMPAALREWKQPINFYGRVEDEEKRPVDGAKISFQWTDVSESGTSRADVLSDPNGLFSLTERQGKHLCLSIEKEGYYRSGAARVSCFEFANPDDGLFTPDPTAPVIFKLWKKRAEQPVQGRSIRLAIMQDGQPLHFDPVQGATSADGLLTFRFVTGAPDEFFHADMKLTISLSGGGIQKADGEFPFTAPSDGYQSSVEFNVGKDARSGFVEQYFFHLDQSGVFGRIQVHIPSFHKRGMSQLVFNWWMDGNGSRNLESDLEALGEP